uniref:Ribosomal protein S1, mitochondrial n=1 Tax=Tanacetum cinerariifolium TaxID=118510 RepID=A0A699HGY8_TANCI|nr:ribosomal protein S1, mitochondrial [Tanacetum cinerariifolium]
MFLVDAGLATARMSMQDEPKGVPINRATRFENKRGGEAALPNCRGEGTRTSPESTKRLRARLTDFSESEEDLSSDHPEHEGAALDVRSAAKERRKGPCSFSPCSDDALLARGATYRKKKRISLSKTVVRF